MYDDEALRAECVALRAEVTRLKAAEERFRLLFEHASDAHLIFDESGILDCNAAAIAMLRCTDKSHVVSLHPAALSPEIQPDGRRSIEKAREMDGLARAKGFHRFEWVHRRMTGGDFPVEVTLTPVTLEAGSALLVVWHDLSEARAREAALRDEIARGAEQQAKIRRLMAPVIEVLEGVVMVPIIGDLDAASAADVTRRLLDELARRSAHSTILDLTGLGAVDGATASHLVQVLRAARLLGVRGMIAGVAPHVARALVALDADLSGGVRVYATVREALADCPRGAS